MVNIFSYAPLQKILYERNIKKTDLMKYTEISSATLAKLSKDEDVKLSTLIKICKVLNCTLDDIVEIKSENM